MLSTTFYFFLGSESREMVETHVKAHFLEIDHAVQEGIKLKFQGVDTTFNVVVFLVADLMMLKEVIGLCQPKSTYGCYQCKLPMQQWALIEPKTGDARNLTEMEANGLKAVETLGKKPDKDSPNVKKFQLSHFGQWVSSLVHFMTCCVREVHSLQHLFYTLLVLGK